MFIILFLLAIGLGVWGISEIESRRGVSIFAVFLLIAAGGFSSLGWRNVEQAIFKDNCEDDGGEYATVLDIEGGPFIDMEGYACVYEDR